MVAGNDFLRVFFQFAAVGCLCMRMWDFFQGGLYRIDCWLVVFSIKLCV